MRYKRNYYEIIDKINKYGGEKINLKTINLEKLVCNSQLLDTKKIRTLDNWTSVYDCYDDLIYTVFSDSFDINDVEIYIISPDKLGVNMEDLSKLKLPKNQTFLKTAIAEYIFAINTMIFINKKRKDHIEYYVVYSHYIRNKHFYCCYKNKRSWCEEMRNFYNKENNMLIDMFGKDKKKLQRYDKNYWKSEAADEYKVYEYYSKEWDWRL